MVMKRALLLLSLSALGCGEEAPQPLTQLVLVAGTDIATVRSVRFDVSQGDKTKSSQGDVDLATPSFVNLLYQRGSLGPVDIVAEGRNVDDQVVLSRRARVSFVRDQTLVVPLHLLASCVATQPTCDSARETCTENGCTSFVLEEDDLEDWNGTPPKPGASNGGNDASMPSDASLDGGERDGGDEGGASSGDEGGASSGGDSGSSSGADGGPSTGAGDGGAMCDGQSVDLDSDEAHCGDCDVACEQAEFRQTALCKSGVCTYPCEDGWDDCGSDDGCETNLTANDTCGSCTNKCNGQTKRCVDMTCVK